jgi:hypothetical protein
MMDNENKKETSTTSKPKQAFSRTASKGSPAFLSVPFSPQSLFRECMPPIDTPIGEGIAVSLHVPSIAKPTENVPNQPSGSTQTPAAKTDDKSDETFELTIDLDSGVSPHNSPRFG